MPTTRIRVSLRMLTGWFDKKPVTSYTLPCSTIHASFAVLCFATSASVSCCVLGTAEAGASLSISVLPLKVLALSNLGVGCIATSSSFARSMCGQSMRMPAGAKQLTPGLKDSEGTRAVDERAIWGTIDENGTVDCVR
jgi:hypothetical protein